MIRRRARPDANQAQLVAELRARGYAVSDLSSIGGGCPDLFISKDGRAMLVEVKNAAARGGRKRGASDAEKLARQAAWRERHPGVCVVAFTVEDVEEAFAQPSNRSADAQDHPERPR